MYSYTHVACIVRYCQFQFRVHVPVLCFFFVRITSSGHVCTMDHARWYSFVRLCALSAERERERTMVAMALMPDYFHTSWHMAPVYSSTFAPPTTNKIGAMGIKWCVRILVWPGQCMNQLKLEIEPWTGHSGRTDLNIQHALGAHLHLG